MEANLSAGGQIALVCLVLCAAAGAPRAVVGAEGRLSLVAASDYVHRGLSLNDAGPALLAGASYRFDQGVYAGVWAATVSNSRTIVRDAAGRFEVNYLVGYSRPWREAWDYDVAALRYEYPGSDAPIDYGYTELAASIGYGGWLWFSAAASRDATLVTLRGLEYDVSTVALELAVERPLRAWLSWAAGAGYFDFRDGAAPGYAYFNAGLAARFRRLEAELQYIDTARGERLFGRRLAGPRVVFLLMASF